VTHEFRLVRQHVLKGHSTLAIGLNNNRPGSGDVSSTPTETMIIRTGVLNLRSHVRTLDYSDVPFEQRRYAFGTS
jgi:hypothetical protein